MIIKIPIMKEKEKRKGTEIIREIDLEKEIGK